MVARLAPLLEASNAYYVDGKMTPAALSRYTELPHGHWGAFAGPCYVRSNSSVPG